MASGNKSRIETYLQITRNIKHQDALMAARTTTYNVAPASIKNRKEAAQDDYGLALSSFLDSPYETPSIQRLCWSLASRPTVTLSEAECVMSHLPPILKRGEDAPEMIAAMCELVLRLWLTVENTRHLATSENIERISAAYRDLALRPELPNFVIVHISQVAILWTELVYRHLLEDFQCYSLVTCGMKWVFLPENHNSPVIDKGRRVFGDLLVAVFVVFPGSRSSIVSDTLEAYFRQYSSLKKVRGLPLSSSGLKQEFIYRGSGLLLQFVAAAGSIPLRVWDRACSIRDRSLLESEAQKYHLDALKVCNQISSTIIDRAYTRGRADRSRSAAQSLVEDFANALRCPECPGAEILVSCFLASLFTMSGVSHKDKAYPVFALDMVRTLHDSLWSISVGATPGNAEDVIAELWHLSSQKRSLAAQYLASRQCLLPNQPYFDLHSQITENCKGPNTFPGERWSGVLRQWPVSLYYSQLSQLILEISRDNDISEKYQVEILKVLDCCIQKDPRYWYSGLLFKLRSGGPSLCDAVAQVCGTYLESRELDSEQDQKTINALAQRFGTPGTSSYKKRVAGMLVDWCCRSKSSDIQLICLKNILKLCADSEKSVRETGKEAFTHLFNGGQGWAGPDPLAKAILGIFQLGSTWHHLLRDSLTPLLQNEANRKHVQNLVMNLLKHDDLPTAAIFLEENGRCMPLAQLKPLFETAKNRESPLDRRLASWRMLYAAFTCRPRLILGPRLATEMFSQMKHLVSSASEPEFEYIGPILWQLSLLGSTQQVRARQADLMELIEKASAVLETRDPKDTVVYARISAIVELSRFWPDPESIRDTDEAAYNSARNRVSKLVESFCRLALDQLDKGSPLRLMLLRVVFRLCSSYNELFALPIFRELCRVSMDDLYSSDAAQVMELLYKQMWNSKSTTSKKLSGTVLEKQLFGNSETDFGEYAKMGLFQQHFDDILTRVLDEDSQSVTAMQVVAKTVDQDRADVARALPSIASLVTSSNTELAQIALWCFEKFCDRNVLLVTKKFPDSFMAAIVHRQKKTRSGDLQGDCGLAQLWHILTSRSKTLGSAIVRLVEALPHKDKDYCIAFTSSLGKAQLTTNDAKLLVEKLDNVITGFNCADNANTATQVAIMIVAYAFLFWARRHYGLDGDVADEALVFAGASSLIEKFGTDLETAREGFEVLRKLRHRQWNSPEFKAILRQRKRGRAILD